MKKIVLIGSVALMMLGGCNSNLEGSAESTMINEIEQQQEEENRTAILEEDWDKLDLDNYTDRNLKFSEGTVFENVHIMGTQTSYKIQGDNTYFELIDYENHVEIYYIDGINYIKYNDNYDEIYYKYIMEDGGPVITRDDIHGVDISKYINNIGVGSYDSVQKIRNDKIYLRREYDKDGFTVKEILGLNAFTGEIEDAFFDIENVSMEIRCNIITDSPWEKRDVEYLDMSKEELEQLRSYIMKIVNEELWGEYTDNILK